MSTPPDDPSRPATPDAFGGEPRRRPAALDAIGGELRRTAARDAARSAPRRWWSRGRRPLVVLVALAVPSAAVAAVVQRSDVPAPRPADVPRESQVVAASVAVSALRVPDPAGGYPWTVRTARSLGGQRCITIGQIDDDERFGIVGRDGRFRTLADGIVDACADADGPGPWISGARTLAGTTDRPAVTVVSALFAAPVRNATVTTSDGPATPARSDDASRTLLAVLPADDNGPMTIRARYASGDTVRVPIGRSALTLAAGDQPGRWRFEADTSRTRRVLCAAVGSADGRNLAADRSIGLWGPRAATGRVRPPPTRSRQPSA